MCVAVPEWPQECKRNSTHRLCSAFLFITQRLDPGKERLIPSDAHTLQLNLFWVNSAYKEYVFITSCHANSTLTPCTFFQEEKKILFYHPSDVEKNEKIRNVGLCEAIVQFTR